MLPPFSIYRFSHQDNPNKDSLWLVHYNKKNCKAKALIDMPPPYYSKADLFFVRDGRCRSKVERCRATTAQSKKEDLRSYKRPYDDNVAKKAFPRDYVPPKFDTFDGTGDPKEHIAHFEYLAKFQTQCVDIAQHEKLLIKQFPSSLRRNAFCRFSRLKAGSIRSWDKLFELLCSRFPSLRKSITSEDLRRSKQEKNPRGRLSYGTIPFISKPFSHEIC